MEIKQENLPLNNGERYFKENSIQNKPKNNIIVHPVQIIEKNNEIFEKRANYQIAKNTFGEHMIMRFMIEEQFFSEPMRLPGLSSSFIGLETILGKDDSISLNDYLNSGFESPEESLDLHQTMEKKLGFFN
ncbi:proteasome maturation protein ump1 [Anaeramoeba ignava]|uniref:Proteasome maturation protein ump1 n=1 Tax=Anaeramoeba ignava TaxID=1746090 RepID=A0A9Q0LEM2_ANAIG|nr:proteasome maturation protein ump1 [Anaeramoeba ignava]